MNNVVAIPFSAGIVVLALAALASNGICRRKLLFDGGITGEKW